MSRRKPIDALTTEEQVSRIRELCEELEAALHTAQEQRDSIAKIRSEADELCKAVSSQKPEPTEKKRKRSRKDGNSRRT